MALTDEIVDSMANAGLPEYTKGPRLASIGIPIGFTGNDSNLTGNGMAYMPDGLIMKEANTFDNKPFDPGGSLADIIRASSDVDWNNFNNPKLQELNQRMINDVGKIQPIETNNIPSGNPMFPISSEGRLGVYFPQRRNGNGELYVRKSLEDDMKRGITDHEVGHGVQEETLKPMYERPKYGNYKDKLSERISYTYGGRQLPPKFTETNSSDYIHPLAMWSPDENKFVNGSEAWMRSSGEAIPKGKASHIISPEYNKNLNEHIQKLNNRLFNDKDFLDDINTYYGEHTKYQNNSALTLDKSWMERIYDYFTKD